MKKICLLCAFLWFVSSLLVGSECLEDDFDFDASADKILDKRINYFLTSTDYKIASKVNPVTGEYSEEETDLIVHGAQPLSVRRFYNSSTPYDARYATWRYNPESYCVANFEYAQQEIFASIGSTNGSISCLKRSEGNYHTFHFKVAQNFAIVGDGTTHPLNTKLNYWRYGDPKDKKRFQYMGTIVDGSGRKREFASPMHRWTNSVSWREKKKGRVISWDVSPNVWTPYQIPVTEEKLPNGNIICYTYRHWLEPKKNFPYPYLIHTITAFNSDKSQELGSLQFIYPRNKDNEIIGVEVTGSDGRKSTVQYSNKRTKFMAISAAWRAGQPTMTYSSDKQFLNAISKPEGRAFTTQYNNAGKVIAQQAPVGPNGEMVPIAQYEYQLGATIFYDGENNKTIYRYDNHKKITAIEVYDGDQLYRVERFKFEVATGNLLRKTVEDSLGNALLITEYQYDKNQNPILERTGDGRSWREIKRTYSDDGFNLKLSESDRKGKLIRYSYVPNTNLLSSELVYEGHCIRKRTFHMYDSCAICIKIIIDDGQTTNPNNLEGVRYRTIREITPKKNYPCWGLPEEIKEKTIDAMGKEILVRKTVYTYTPFGAVLQEDHYDANENLHYSIQNTYDDQERRISTTDPMGHETLYRYDANFNVIAIDGPKVGYHREIIYDKANRPTTISDCEADGSILTMQRRYDRMGRVIEEIDVCNQSTFFEYDSLGRLITTILPDKTTEHRSYDLLDHVVKEQDGAGYETISTFDCFGNVLSINYPDQSQENFTYNTTGTINSHLDKNQTLTTYTYDIWDHPIKTVVSAKQGKVIKIKSATYTPFTKLTEIDGEGYTTFFQYDFCGRKIAEEIETKKTTFTYNPAGLLEITNFQYYAETITYDRCGRPIKKTIGNREDQWKEEYAYDEVSNQTQRSTGHGTFYTNYNFHKKPVEDINPHSYVTKYNYSYKNNYKKLTKMPNGTAMQNTYDSLGREIQCVKKNKHNEIIAQTDSSYDLNGNLSTQIHYIYRDSQFIEKRIHDWKYGPMNRLERFIEAGTKITDYSYDENGRLKTITKPSGIQLHHEYDEAGRLFRLYSHDFDYQYSYDRNDRVIVVCDKISKTKTLRRYDAFGNMAQEILDTGFVFKSEYDDHGRRVKLILPDKSCINFNFDGAYLYNIERKNYCFIYKNRDLDGHPLEMTLPGDVGSIIIERDGLARISDLYNPTFQAHFPLDAYDSVGNLLYYEFEDPLGKMPCAYSYDALNQLILENNHNYRCDSLNNRLQKDYINYDVNQFCQILNDGVLNYSFDTDGNLSSDGIWNYFYDSQNRLISLEKIALEGGSDSTRNNPSSSLPKERIEYTYDSFHRRLTKSVYVEDQLTDYERYLWDKDHEIGTMDRKGKIVQLRVLGDGLVADIGAAVLCEFHDQTYVPLHDHRGNVVTLIDVKTRKPVETHRYTAFGEENDGASISPWGFSSKRRDQETGLIFFGRRYYLPKLGRWISHDPLGFNDGPNLYAYLRNNPFISMDAYGLCIHDALDEIGTFDCAVQFFDRDY